MPDTMVITATAYGLVGLGTLAFFWHNLIDRADPFESNAARWALLTAYCVLVWPVVWALAAVYRTAAGRRCVNRLFGYGDAS